MRDNSLSLRFSLRSPSSFSKFWILRSPSPLRFRLMILRNTWSYCVPSTLYPTPAALTRSCAVVPLAAASVVLGPGSSNWERQWNGARGTVQEIPGSVLPWLSSVWGVIVTSLSLARACGGGDGRRGQRTARAHALCTGRVVLRRPRLNQQRT